MPGKIDSGESVVNEPRIHYTLKDGHIKVWGTRSAGSTVSMVIDNTDATATAFVMLDEPDPKKWKGKLAISTGDHEIVAKIDGVTDRQYTQAIVVRGT